MTFEREMAMAVALAVKSATAPLLAQQAVLAERIAQLETRAAAVEARGLDCPAGPPGIPGPPGRDGVDGKDGAAGLNGKDGRDGLDGQVGAVGLPGKDGLDGKDGAAGRNGNDGAPGLNGKDGADGAAGKDGAPGLNGQDGVGLADALIDRDGRLVLTMSDGRTKTLAVVIGKDGRDGIDGKDGAAGLSGKDGAPGLNGKDGSPGANGKDGTDGLGFEDVNFTFDAVKGYAAVFSRGELVKEQRIHLPYDARVWQAGLDYPRGAGVTVKGSWWIAQEDNRNVRPGDGTPESARCWRLAVKAGQNGKDGKDLRSADE